LRYARVLAAMLALESGCARHPDPPRDVVPASRLAAAEGVSGYRPVHVGKNDLEVQLIGTPGGRFMVRASAERVAQSVELASGAAIDVRTSAALIAVVREGNEVLLAHHDGARWVDDAPLAPREDTAWRTLAAVDVDMAMQGTSVTSGGTRYVSCTAQCIAAAECVRRSESAAVARCAFSFTTCSACLEVEP
jgi:hypothetical protein